MDRLLDLYNRELAYLREMGAEFAREYPKIAGRLGGLDDFQVCPDPFVERLLEGFAFLSARVQLKLEAGFPRFTQALLDTVYPDYLAPTPSTCIVQFEPESNDPILANGFPIPRESLLTGLLGKEQTRCAYRTAHNVTLWPLKIAEAGYYVRELGTLELDNAPNAKACVRIQIQPSGNIPLRQMAIDSLVLHLDGSGETPAMVYEQLFANATEVVLQSATKPVRWRQHLNASCLHPVGFKSEESLLPYDGRSFDGYRLLREYFALPQRFLFFELTGLRSAVQRCGEDRLDIFVLLGRAEPRLENALGADNFKLFCTPAANVFPKRLDRIPVTRGDSEFHVVADRTKRQDFEIYRVTSVEGYGEGSSQAQEFAPFYFSPDSAGARAGAFYQIHRVPRQQEQDERSQDTRSQRPQDTHLRSYAGSEVYLSLVDGTTAPYSRELKQLGVEALCTNRDLPLHMPKENGITYFRMEKTVPCRPSIRCLGTPRPPQPSFVHDVDAAWRAISHLSLNYLSLTDKVEGKVDGKGASALRDILRLYCPSGDADSVRRIEGIRSIDCRPSICRVTSDRAVSFARGIRVTVTCEEALFTGTGVFVLGAVLRRFFAKYVSVNSFAETVIRTSERGEIMKWTLENGLRSVL